MKGYFPPFPLLSRLQKRAPLQRETCKTLDLHAPRRRTPSGSLEAERALMTHLVRQSFPTSTQTHSRNRVVGSLPCITKMDRITDFPSNTLPLAMFRDDYQF